MNNSAYYECLGLKPGASDSEIKRAYRKLARKYHPDVSDVEDAEARFKEMKEAYECLSDTKSRAAYDSFGEHWKAAMEAGVEPGTANGQQTWGPGTHAHQQYHSAGNADFGDLFDSIFADRNSEAIQNAYRSYRDRGEDVHARMQISLADSFHGVTRQIEFDVLDYRADGQPQSRRRKLDVTIPKGVVTGQRVRLKGQGQASFSGGDSGDLYVEIILAPHSSFEVCGRDIHSKLKIAPWQAALGDKVRVDTLGGAVKAKVPPASSSGSVLRLKGGGLPGKSPGDHYVEIAIDMSSARSEPARKLYERLRQLEIGDSVETV